MSSIKRLVSGALFGGALLTVSSLTLPYQAAASETAVESKWAVSCDGNYCCTVNQDTGARGDCWYR